MVSIAYLVKSTTMTATITRVTSSPWITIGDPEIGSSLGMEASQPEELSLKVVHRQKK